MKKKITDTTLERLPRPEKGTLWLTDTDMSGFQAAVSKKSIMLYAFAVSSASGKRQGIRVPLGYWPHLKAFEARNMASKAIAEIRMGGDPRRPKHDGLRFKDAFEKALKEREADLRPATAKSYRDFYKLHLSHLDDVYVTAVTADTIRDLKEKLAAKPYTFNACKRIMSATFSTLGLANPTTKVKGFKEHKRQSKIASNKDWYGKVMADDNHVRRNYLLLGALTGIRRENLASLTWKQVDLNKRRIHLPTAKHNTNVHLPISNYAATLFNELAGLHETWVFPAPRSKKRGYITEWRSGQDGTFHDLRRMFTSACAKARLFGPALAKMRGDVMSETAEGYFTEDAPLDWAEDVTKVLLKDWGVQQ